MEQSLLFDLFKTFDYITLLGPRILSVLAMVRSRSHSSFRTALEEPCVQMQQPHHQKNVGHKEGTGVLDRAETAIFPSLSCSGAGKILETAL